MNFSFPEKILVLITLLLLKFIPLYCQQPVSSSSDSAGIYSQVLKAYRSDQVLINGIYNENYYRNALGHPFMLENRFYPGYIVIHNKRFNNLSLKYNLFEQNVVLVHDLNTSNQVEYIPPVAFVSEFSLNGKLFRRYRNEEGKESFFQVVYDGKIKCLYSWEKERIESFHNARVASYKFNDEVKKSYLLIDNKLFKYRSPGSFIGLFPKELASQIKNFCRKESINLSTAQDLAMAKLLSFCEELTNPGTRSLSTETGRKK
jgi:hypothetical protein